MASLPRILPTSSTFEQNEDESSFFTNLLSRFKGKENELHCVLQTEKSYLSVDEKIRNDIDISQSELVSLTNEVLDSDDFLQQLEPIDISEITNFGQSNNDVDEFIETLGTSCEDCVTYEKVERLAQIKPGDHIRFHNYKCGINVYNHHAIVTYVQAYENQRVGKMTLVHYQGDIMLKFTVLRDTKEYNTENAEIDIVRNQRPPFTPEQTVDRANKMADEYENNEHAESYNVLENNCEHKANEIATGSKHSKQVSSLANYLTCTISWLLKLCFKVAIQFLKGIKQFIRGSANAMVIYSLLQIVDRMAMLKNKLEKGLICLKHYENQQRIMSVSLIFNLISIGISVMYHVSWLYFAVNTAIACALPCIAPFFTDTIIPIFQPASKIAKPVVKPCKMIRNGDVITFPYCGLYHKGVTTRVFPDNTNDVHKVKLTLVHFNYPGLFGTRTFVKEVFYFNLKDQNIYVYDFSTENPFIPHDVVKRALDMCGNQNFGILSNRSSHMSRHCKTGKTELKKIPYKKAEEISDFSPGDVINFTYCCLSHEAVVVKVDYPETFKCSVVHYNYAGVFGTRTIVEEDFIFKLADRNVFIHDYDGYDTYSREEVVRRAKSRLGEQKFNTFYNRSSHLAKWCKIKE